MRRGADQPYSSRAGNIAFGWILEARRWHPMSDEKDKTAIRTAKSGRNGQEIPLGAHPGNTGGKPGRSGRIPEKVKVLADELSDRYQLLPMLAKIAANVDEETRDRVMAAKVVLEYTHRKPAKVVLEY